MKTRIIISKFWCFILGHLDAPYDYITFHREGSQVVWSWMCTRCKRVREYER